MVTNNTVTAHESRFEHGSQIVRVDFHLHTKADKEFFYDGDERRFCKDYVRRLAEEDIAVGVITNHNKFDWDEFKALRKVARKEDILLLPGVELSVSDGASGIHALIVFGEDWLGDGVDRITPVINAAFGGQPPQNVRNRNMRTKYNLLDTINFLEESNADFFLVFAHVQQKNGLWKELHGGRLQELGQQSVFRRRTLGFQKVNKDNEQGRERVRDWFVDWYPAEVEGSDCKSIEEIGRGDPCYLQLGELSFGAAKYALSDHPNRVCREHKKVRHSHIRSATFEGGVLDGKTVNFSPHLNTFIGVRGSGKSSILESVRYALDVPFGNKASDQGYKQNLVGHVLGSGGAVTLRAVDARGQTFEVRRILGEEPTARVDGVEQPDVSVRETVVYNPLYFGQKDLAASGEGFEKDLVEKFIWKNLQTVRARIDSQRHTVRQVVDRLAKLSDTDERKRELELKRGNAEFKLQLYEKYGIEDKLKTQLNFDADERHCARLESATESYLSGIDALLDEVDGSFEAEMSYEPQQNDEFFRQMFEVFQENIRSFEKLKKLRSGVEVNLKRLEEKTHELRAERDSLREEFAEINRKMADEFADTEITKVSAVEYRELRNTVAEATNGLKDLGREEARRDSLAGDLRRELTTLEGLWQEEYQAIRHEVDKVNQKNQSLKISVGYKADKQTYLERLKEACKGSRIRESTLELLIERFSDFGAMYKSLEKAKEVIGGSASRFEDYFTRDLSHLLTWQVPHGFTIEYRGRNLRHHSLGQRASALIIFILSQQDNDLILIDQPEDDLDSQTVYEDVVKLVRRLKPEVQFIFATHNANFPVLGDAEQVSSCDYSDDEISVTSGSIDSQELQRLVVNIMEGGSEAFRQRRKIYEMWDE